MEQVVRNGIEGIKKKGGRAESMDMDKEERLE